MAVLVGQFGGDALAKGVEVTHQLGHRAGGAHSGVFGVDGFEQPENLKLLVVAQSLALAHHRLRFWACLGGMIDQQAWMSNFLVPAFAPSPTADLDGEEIAVDG